MKPERHLFVCVNQRPEGGKPACGARGAALFTALQEEIGRRPALWGRVAVTSTGCLGPCFEGPAAVVYPDAVWYVGVAPDDAAAIVEDHVVGGHPVARLVRQESEEP